LPQLDALKVVKAQSQEALDTAKPYRQPCQAMQVEILRHR